VYYTVSFNQPDNFMELRIDLSDRADIEAAHALLATILGANGLQIDGGDISIKPVLFNGTQSGLLPDPPSELIGGNDPMGSALPDPEQVAQSIAGVGQLPNVPVGLLAGAADPSAAPQTPAANAPAAAAPSAPAAASPAAGADSEGLQWDARIHSKPPTINKSDGKYRAKRGLSEVEANVIKAEIRQVAAIPNPATGSSPAAGVPTPAVAAPVAPPAPAAAPAAPPAPTAPAAPSADPTTFQELMPRVTAANAAGTLPQSALLDAVLAYALPNIPALVQRPDLVPYVWTFLKSSYPALV
jgi:hypothetical protein